MDASIIVPLTGGPDRALACVQALAALPAEPTFEVVVVDDASVGLQDLLARLAGDVTLVRLDRPSGVAAATAAALREARGRVVVLLRDAVEVEPGFLAPLVAALDNHPALAAAAPSGTAAVAAPALAWRRDDLPASAVPGAPDDYAVAALCTALASRGRVETITASAVRAPVERAAGARAHLGAEPELTVVIPTLDAAGRRAHRCVEAIQATTDVPHEIVVVDNGAPPQGFTAPVNAGLRAARGAYAVVCNDDVEVQPGWWAPLRAALSDPADPAAVAFPMTVDGAMRTDFAAWCFALSRRTLTEFASAPGEFLHPELRVWYQDTDLLARLRAAGRPPVLVAESTVRHGLSETVATADPALRAWIDATIRDDRMRFEALHGPAVAGAAR